MNKKEYSAPEIEAITIDSDRLMDGLGTHSTVGTDEFSKEMGYNDMPFDEDDNESDD